MIKPSKVIKAKAKQKPSLPTGIDSKYELEYLRILEDRKYMGHIHDFALKPGSWRIGDNSHYQPDFLVIAADGTVEYHEVKGRTRYAKASLTKIKAAARLYPWITFCLIYGNVEKDQAGKRQIKFDRTDYGS